MDEYIEEFESLIVQIPPMPDDQYMGLILGGLDSRGRYSFGDSNTRTV